jgi:hypothetical protein
MPVTAMHFAKLMYFEPNMQASVLCLPHPVMMIVIRLIINNEAIFLYISLSLLVYFSVYLLGKNQKTGVWKIGQVDGLRVKVRPGWKRQIAQQVGWVFLSKNITRSEDERIIGRQTTDDGRQRTDNR